MGDLTNLRVLNLHSNRLSGPIPESLGNLSNLRELWLHANYRKDDPTTGLSGSIPDSLGNLSNLEKMKLRNNRLTGPIPASLGRLDKLEWLVVHNNLLAGPVPPELGDMDSLEILWLGGNELSGSIPEQLGSLSNLTQLHLRTNQLTGSIPGRLGDLSKLKDLLLHDNRLTGSIPTELGSLESLRRLWLSQNELTASIPASLGDLPALTQLNLHTNMLSGSIPSELGDLADTLTRLRLSNGNTFTGCVPAALEDVEDNDIDQLGLATCSAPPVVSGSSILTIEPPAEFEPFIANIPAVIQPRVTYTGNHRLSYSLVDEPEGMYINFNNGTITWTPSEEDEGNTSHVTVRAGDGTRFAETTFQVTVVEPEPIETKITESQVDGNKLTVTDNDTDLAGLEITSPPEEAPLATRTLQILQEALGKVSPESVPEIPSHVTRMSDVFVVKSTFDNPVELRFPLSQFPIEFAIDELTFYARYRMLG